MVNSLITHLQIFGIGFSFGIAGPCLLLCTPILLTYVVGSGKSLAGTIKDIIVFLSGRLAAYAVLGFLAGLSGAVLKSFTSPAISAYFRPLAGAVTIFFAFMILLNKDDCGCPGREPRKLLMNFGGVFVFGLIIGLSPCAPLLALLFDIVLMSKGALDGMSYALSFGLGTFLSGLISIGIIAGLLTRVPAAVVKSKAANTVFKAACAILLAGLGLGIILLK